MKRLCLPIVRFATLALLLALAGACSQAVPIINTATLRVVYRELDDTLRETLSVQVLASDEDGFADLDELYLIHDASQLYWKLTAEDWLYIEESNQDWIGSNFLRMPDGQIFPRGLYRVLLIDKAGDRVERELALDADIAPRRSFPRLALSGSAYEVFSEYPRNSLACYNESGALIKMINLIKKQGSIDELRLGVEVRSVALWSEDESGQVAAFTLRMPVP